MRRPFAWLLGACLVSLPAAAADPPVRLVVKPLLCVIDKNASACTVTFDIRWKSVLAAATRTAALLAARDRGRAPA
jgi:hypothetical protein